MKDYSTQVSEIKFSRKLFSYDDIHASLKSEAEEIIRSAVEKSKYSEHPKFIHMCGIPGCGKSTYVRDFIKNNPDFSVASMDQIMFSFSGYISDIKTLGLEHAFSKWEAVSATTCYHLIQALIENNRNIIFDHSAANNNHIELVDTVLAYGFEIEMHYLECPLPVALQRVKEREQRIKRHTPESLIHGRNELLAKLIPVYKSKIIFQTIPYQG